MGQTALHLLETALSMLLGVSIVLLISERARIPLSLLFVVAVLVLVLILKGW